MSKSKSEPQYMQRNVWVARIESVALTPWLKGGMRVALEWARAPELINGVPLQSGQYAARRLKKAMNHVTTLNPMPLRITFTASWLGSMQDNTTAVSVVMMPRECSAEKNAATVNGLLDGSDRARSNFAWAGGWGLLVPVVSGCIPSGTLQKTDMVCKS